MIVIGSPPVNRGVAVLDDMVYVGSIAGHLTALDAKSGAVRWDVVVDDNHLGYYLTLAPLAVDGKIIVGVSGAEAGIRGFIDAYDAKTGKRVWRRHTIPAPGEPGFNTWGGDSWKTGGGSTWLTGSYDPELKTLYWTTGNPGPDWNGDNRPGDNLYTCSLLALNPDDGSIKWHFQFTPHDMHDWDAVQNVILFDAHGRTAVRAKLVAQANRNGFYYVLDRTNGEFLAGAPYVEADVGGRPRREGPAECEAGPRTEHRGRDGVSEHLGRGELVQPELQPEDEPLLSGGARVVARSSTRAKRCTNPGSASLPAAAARRTATMRGRRCARSRRRPGS